MEEVRNFSKELEELGNFVIDDFEKFSFIKENDIAIGYLYSNKEKKSSGRVVFGECEKVQSKNKWAIPYDFLITFYAPNTQFLTDAQKKYLMEHELMHIGQDDKGHLKINPHDIEDFAEILTKYGMNWSLPEGE